MTRLLRFIVTALGLFLVALIWNGFVHLVLLRRAEASIQHLRRTDLPGGLWWQLLLTATLCVAFVWGYTLVARTGSRREGLVYGLFFGLLAGLLVDANQYLLYPLPGALVLQWFAGGVLEFLLYGAITSKLCGIPSRHGSA